MTPNDGEDYYDRDDYDDRDDEFADDELCPQCFGDGMDPDSDYLLPCPLCQGEQRP